MRLGLLGGTFDPPHIGHLIIGEQARVQLNLDKIIFLPAGDPYFKHNTRKITPSKQRLEMVKLAIENNENFTCSSIEIERVGNTYTIDTVREIIDCYPSVELYFIVGSDSFNQITKWHAYQELLALINFVCVQRPGKELDWPLFNKINADYGEGKVVHVEIPNIQISSTVCRELIRAGKSVKYYLPSSVRDYIQTYQLYR